MNVVIEGKCRMFSDFLLSFLAILQCMLPFSVCVGVYLLAVLVCALPSLCAGLRPGFSQFWSTPSPVAVLVYALPPRSAYLRPACLLLAVVMCMVFTHLLLVMYQCLFCLSFSIFALGYLIYSIFYHGYLIGESSCYHQ